MKTALIIGATGGIGGALVRELKDLYQITAVGRDARRLRALGDGVSVVPTDLTSELEVEALFAESPSFDLIVYAAGDVASEGVEQASSATWERLWAANVGGLVHVLKHGAKRLNEGARVYVFGARPELVSVRGLAAYAASKAAAAALVKVAALELRRRASLTLVLPPAVDTPLWDKLGQRPKRALAPEEVARALARSLHDAPVAELRMEG